ncbi:MAG: 23S rRNA (guanosine(2251)-2'-O)-methyltransferase RlmB [Rhodospirillaceae bacterium]
MGASEVWLYGRHPIEAALANPERTVRRLLATPDAADSIPAGLLSQRGIRPETVARAELDAFLPSGAVHQGLALRVDALPALDPDDVVALAPEGKPAVVIALDQVTDPHNVGAVLRSAAAFGALAVVVQDRHSPDETGVLAKAASGALERVPLVRVANLARALDRFRDSGFWTAGLAADARHTVAGAKLPDRVVLILGSEGQGMRRLTREHCDHLVRLPMVAGAIESLNVSNAAAVALYAVTHASLEAAENDIHS